MGIGVNLAILSIERLRHCNYTVAQIAEKVKGLVETIPKRHHTSLIKINMLWKPLDCITTQNINQKAVFYQITKSSAQNTSIDIFPFVEDLDWGKIYTLPYFKTRGVLKKTDDL